MMRAIRHVVFTIAVSGLLVMAAFIAPVAAGVPQRPVTPASPASWSAPTKALAGNFGEVSEVVDSQGHVHLAVTGKDGIWYATDRTGSWTHRRVLANSSKYDYGSPSIALDEHDRVHIAAERFPNAEGDLGIWYVTDVGRARGTFSPSPIRIAPPGNGQPVLKASNGHLFLVDVKGWCCIGGGTVQLRTNVTGTWTVSDIGMGGGPSFRLGSDHRARVAYAGDPGGIWYAVASSPSGHFTREKLPSAVTSPSDSAIDVGPILALNVANEPRIAWRHYGAGSTLDVLYAWHDASGWHAPISVASGLPENDLIGFDADTHGRPNVAIGGAGLHVRVLSGGTWHESTVTTAHAGGPVVRRGLHGQVVVAWSNAAGAWVSRN